MEFSRAINDEGYLYVPYAEVKDQETELKSELKLYKEALNIACTELTHRQMSRWCDCKCEKCRYYPDECVNHIDAEIKRCLQKARDQNNDF